MLQKISKNIRNYPFRHTLIKSKTHSGFAAEAEAAGIAAEGRKAGCGMLFIAANQEADTAHLICLPACTR